MTIYRIRRLSTNDEPELCGCCNNDLTKGFVIHVEFASQAVRVCDDCLAAAKGSELGFHKSDDHRDKS